MLLRWPLLYRVVFEAWKMLARGTDAGRSGLNEVGRQLMGWPLNSRLNRPLRKFWAIPRLFSVFDKQPLVTKFVISIETLPGTCVAKSYPACAYQKRKRSNASVSYEPHH